MLIISLKVSKFKLKNLYLLFFYFTDVGISILLNLQVYFNSSKFENLIIVMRFSEILINSPRFPNIRED